MEEVFLLILGGDEAEAAIGDDLLDGTGGHEDLQHFPNRRSRTHGPFEKGSTTRSVAGSNDPSIAQMFDGHAGPGSRSAIRLSGAPRRTPHPASPSAAVAGVRREEFASSTPSPSGPARCRRRPLRTTRYLRPFSALLFVRLVSAWLDLCAVSFLRLKLRGPTAPVMPRPTPDRRRARGGGACRGGSWHRSRWPWLRTPRKGPADSRPRSGPSSVRVAVSSSSQSSRESTRETWDRKPEP